MASEKNAKCCDRLRQALRERGVKQSELCEMTKIPKSAISQYVSGAFEPKQDRIYLIAKALNISEAWLLGYDVPMEKDISLDETTLTEREKKLLDLFRSLSEEKQILALQMIQVALGNQ